MFKDVFQEELLEIFLKYLEIPGEIIAKIPGITSKGNSGGIPMGIFEGTPVGISRDSKRNCFLLEILLEIENFCWNSKYSYRNGSDNSIGDFFKDFSRDTTRNSY